MKTIKTKALHRAATIKSGNIDPEKRTVDVSFSSEQPVSRWFGEEVLSHREGHADLSRLNDGAAVLVDHDGDQVGVVETAKIVDGRGMAKLRFSSSARGKEVFQDIEDGIRKNISFGYAIRKMEEEEEGVVRATDWMPFEISVVATPADASIGIGRSIDEFETEVPDNFEQPSEFHQRDLSVKLDGKELIEAIEEGHMELRATEVKEEETQEEGIKIVTQRKKWLTLQSQKY